MKDRDNGPQASTTIHLRVSFELRDRLDDAARLAGVQTPEFLRQAAIAHCSITESQEQIRRILRKQDAE